MDAPHFLAQVWGFSLVVIFLSLLIFPERVKSLWVFAEQPGILFFRGMIRFIAGVAMVTSYNVWDGSWKTIITALGWLLVVSGVWLMYHPQSAQRLAARLKNSNWISLVFVGGVLFGCVLIYFSYTA